LYIYLVRNTITSFVEVLTPYGQHGDKRFLVFCGTFVPQNTTPLLSSSLFERKDGDG
jgi:hypothetical protein